MDSKIHVVQATVSNDRGGLSGYILQNYHLIDKEQFEFTLLSYDRQLDCENILFKKGKEVLYISKPTDFYSYYSQLKRIRRDSRDIIHFNLSYANFIPVVLARLAGYKNIIIHSHSTEIDDGNKVKKLCKRIIHILGKNFFFPFFGKSFWACSQLAGIWMYPKYIMKSKDFFLANNAISLQKYRYNDLIRSRKRKELGLSDGILCLGHIGRFSYQKNHIFLIELLNTIKKSGRKVMLLLIGTYIGGECYYNEVISKIQEYHLEDDVMILGGRNDINELLQAMDYFLLPSRFEGLPIVGIEAQAAGIPCIFSNEITREVGINNNIAFIDVKNIEEWKSFICNESNRRRACDQDELIKSVYSDNEEIIRIKNRYLNLCK